MELALAEASRCAVSGDVPVGAVVIDAAGAVVGTGRNERELTGDPTAHAEVLALRAAAVSLGRWRVGGTLVVTLEPCAMCAGAAVLARVDRVLYAAPDPKAGAAGSVHDLLRDRRSNHRPEVVSGIRSAEASELLTAFFAGRRPGAARLPGGGVA
jgi:tRNA(adenine34) deaminase